MSPSLALRPAAPNFFQALPNTPNRADRAATSRDEAAYDAELVQRFNSGDDTAFVEIMGRYRDKMFAIALMLLRNHADAEEIAQDTFIRAHRGLAAFRGDSSLATWLHRITVNLSRNRYWYFFRRRRHATLSIDSQFGDRSDATFSDLLATDETSPVREAVASEFSAIISGCMDKLDPHQREILALRNLLNRSYDEIARALGINIGTVKSRIARARENLRKLLVATCPEFAADAEPADWFETERNAGLVDIVRA